MLREEVVTLEVTATQVEPGDPPRFAWRRLVSGPGGRRRPIAQMVEVPDADLVQRLRLTVQPGDQVVVTLVTIWGTDNCHTFLRDFALPLPSPAQVSTTIASGALPTLDQTAR